MFALISKPPTPDIPSLPWAGIWLHGNLSLASVKEVFHFFLLISCILIEECNQIKRDAKPVRIKTELIDLCCSHVEK